MYALADDITIDAGTLGVRLRTVDGSGVVLLTTRQAEELADQLVEWTWAGVLCGGGAVLTARACESCVVVRCGGHASADELKRFAAELRAVAAQARRYVPPKAAVDPEAETTTTGGEMTYQPNDRVRLTVPGSYADHERMGRRLGVTLVFRVLDQDGDAVQVAHDVTGRRYVLPEKQLTKVGTQ